MRDEPKRVFLGWDKTTCDAVAELLLARLRENPDVWTRALVITPTKGAGRRLRERLAVLAARENGGNGAVMCPNVVSLGAFVYGNLGESASEGTELATWLQVLHESKEAQDYFHLREESGYDGLLSLAAELQKLRLSLALEARTLEDVARVEKEDAARWDLVIALTSAYCDELKRRGLKDKVMSMFAPRESAHRERVVVACVPGLTQGAIGILHQYADVEVWVHAPDEYHDTFSHWGVPMPVWNTYELEVHDEDILTAEDAETMAEVCLEQVATLSDESEDSVALGVCDRSLRDVTGMVFERSGCPLYDPAGYSITGTEWYGLLTALEDCLDAAEYADPWLNLMRNYLMMSALAPGRQLEVIRAADRVLAQAFPESASYLHTLAGREIGRELAAPLQSLTEWFERFQSSPADTLAGLPGLLVKVDAATFRGAASTARFEGMAADVAAAGVTDPKVCLALLRHMLEGCMIERDASDHRALPMQGWAELDYVPARYLVVAGMSDGVVPEGMTTDSFLTGSLRKKLKMETDETRAARDAFLLRGLGTCRQSADSGLRFVLHKLKDKGEPNAPSSLLMRCPQELLPARVERLFGPPQRARRRPPVPPPGRTLGLPEMVHTELLALPLELRAEHLITEIFPQFENPWADGGKTFSPSSLMPFLFCPFRAWLKRICAMGNDAVPESKFELSNNEYGTLLHAVVERFVAQYPDEDSMPPYEAEDPLWAEIDAMLDEELRATYGRHGLLPMALQREIMSKTLHDFVDKNRWMMRGGWRCEEREFEVGGTGAEPYKLAGFPMNFRIDRIDVRRDPATNEVLGVRVVDYKSSLPKFKPKTPQEKHLEAFGRDEQRANLIDMLYHLPEPTAETSHSPIEADAPKYYRWKELQLPIYAAWALDHYGDVPVETGYFSLSGKVDYLPWQNLFEPVGEMGGDSFFDRAMTLAESLMGMMTRGEGLFCAEDMGTAVPDYDPWVGTTDGKTFIEAWAKQNTTDRQ